MQEKTTTSPQSDALAAPTEQEATAQTAASEGGASQPLPTEKPDMGEGNTAPQAETTEASPAEATAQAKGNVRAESAQAQATEPAAASAHASKAQPSHAFAGAQAAEPVAPPTAEPLPPSGAQRAFAALSRIAPLPLLVLLLAQGWMWLMQPAALLPSEQSNLALVTGMLRDGLWLTPMADANSAGLPFFAWFAGLLSLLPLPDSAWLPPLVGLCAAAVALLGTYSLALACGLGNAVAFAAGLLLLASPAFMGASHYLSPALLCAGITAFALACLLMGWKKERSFVALPLGFVLTALAALCGGVLPFALILLTSLFFIIWTGRLRRAQKTDAIAGFVLMLLILFGWAGLVILTGTRDAYLGLVWQQVIAPFAAPFSSDAVLLPLLLLLLAFLPWPLLLLTVSWGRVLKNAYSDLKASRHENCGKAWLWIALVLGIALCLLANKQPASDFAPLLPLGALALAGALLRLGATGSRVFFGAIAVLCIASALLLASCLIPDVPVLLQSLTLPALLSPCLPLIAALAEQWQAVLIVSALLIIAGALLLRFTCKRSAGGALLVCTLLATVLMQALVLQLSPALHACLAPKANSAPALETAPAAVPPVTPLLSTPAQPAPELNAPALPAEINSKADPTAPAAPSAETAPAAPAAPAEAAKPAVPPLSAPAQEAKPAEAAPLAPAEPTSAAPTAQTMPAEAKAEPAPTAPADAAEKPVPAQPEPAAADKAQEATQTK
jgi:hypothetical protein